MGVKNKAHTATVNRLARRFNTTPGTDGQPDIQTSDVTIEVETTATLSAGVKSLLDVEGPAFVAVTNKEGLTEALKKTKRNRVGVMDPQGEIVKQSDPPLEIADE